MHDVCKVGLGCGDLFVLHRRLFNQPRAVSTGCVTTLPSVICRIDVSLIRRACGKYTPEPSSMSAGWLSITDPPGASPPALENPLPTGTLLVELVPPMSLDNAFPFWAPESALPPLPAFSAMGVRVDVQRNDPCVLTRSHLE